MYERFTLLLGRALNFRLSELEGDDGQGITEYGIAVAFVVVALAAVLYLLATPVTDFINKVGTDLGNLPGNF